MIHASIRMQIPAQKREEVLALFGTLSRKTRNQPGCVSCCVYRSMEDDAILLDEVWDDEAYLEHHLRSADFLKVIVVSELSSAPPDFRFETILHSSGIETIIKARNPSGA